jgi:hypothetical protein
MLFGLLPGLVAAQVAAIGPEVYPAAFFAPYAPQTALDMVQRLPGFPLDLGEAGVRGFAEAGGNVLVDGARPVSKTGGLAAALLAIPASQVARIEIVRNGAVANEASGQAVVANVVRVAGPSGASASARLSLAEGHPLGDLSVTASRRAGGFDLVSRTTFNASGERSHGTRAQFALSGAAKGRQALSYATDLPELTERLTVEGPVADGRLKLAAVLAHARLAETFAFVDASQTERDPKRTRRWRGEVSGDWARPVAGGYVLKLLALASFTDVDAWSASQVGPKATSLVVANLFESKALSRETIVRSTISGAGGAVWRPEIGAEIAWNSLDSRSASTASGAASRAMALVSETRGEAFATLDWRPSAHWAVTLGAAYEGSRLRAEGDAARRDRFGFLKPRLTATYKPDENSNLRVSLRRSVGQLSFNDFAASANLAEGKAYGGNVALRPDHRTTLALDYDRRFSGRGAINLGAFHDWRADVLEPTVLPDGAFGVTNVDEARVWGVSANPELPVDGFAPGGLIKLGYARQGSRVVDPLTGRRRGVTALRPETLTVGFRQDLAAARVSWGFDYGGRYDVRYWYADEVRLLRHAQDLDLYVETVRFADAKLRLQLSGLTGTRNTYARTQYTPDRAKAPWQREVWDIRTPRVATLSLSRDF